MANVRNITVKVGEYEKDGQVKGKYQKVGVVIEKEQGQLSIKLDEIFANHFKTLFGNSFEGWMNVYNNESTDLEEGTPF